MDTRAGHMCHSQALAYQQLIAQAACDQEQAEQLTQFAAS